VDAFLSSDAQRTLHALTLLAPAKCASGLLLGHKRAGRFFVEAAFPAPAGFRPSLENFPALSANFQGRIIGFFLIGGGAADRRLFLQPLACGRCVVTVARPKSGNFTRRGSSIIAKRNFHDIARREPGAISFRAFAIDYDGRFRLDPINVISEKKTASDRRREAPAAIHLLLARGKESRPAPKSATLRTIPPGHGAGKAPHSAPVKPATPRQKRSR